ncbi:DNA polymerase I [Desulfosarcina sp. OttesenSCG-928-G10]|nr:DNA polymerase I [Desulfosarcina sp. OttesenSCG-928-G10]MDL2321972.1 DNA polymerase I [Desulfosarcina sp. OttesenSCG-928-B08]
MSTSPPSTPPEHAPQTLYLIDGSAYIYRAYHAIRGLSNSSGLPTNATFGFTRMLIKLMEDRKPGHVAMFFDAKGPTFRHERFAAYKANRPPMPEDLVQQLPWIRKVTDAFNIPVFELTGYEADDLIGTLSRKAEENGMDVVMVTGDKDFMQLVTDRRTIWDPMKDVVIDEAEIRRQFDLAPGQIIDVMGFSGDTADNVPGVPGIGQKTAVKLIQTFGSMAGVYDRIDEIQAKKQKENLLQFKDQAFLSRDLVTIDQNAPIEMDLETLAAKKPDEEALTRLFGELEFRQLQQTYAPRKEPIPRDYTAILDEAALDALVRRLEGAGRFALDTETTSTSPMRAHLVGLSFSVTPGTAWYIPVDHRYIGAPPQLSAKTVLARLAPVFMNPAIEKIGQNIKYDWMVLHRHGADLAGVAFDTMIASYLLSPAKRAHGLDQIALDYLDHKNITYEEVAGKGKSAVSFDQVPIETATPYACEDADITLSAHEVFVPLLAADGLSDLMDKVEMPLLPVLLKMELTGVCVDRDRLHQLSDRFAKQLSDLEREIYALAGETFNIHSSQQLGEILFEKLKLPVQKKTKKKTGYSTDVEVLTTLARDHALPALMLRHRSLAKLKSTYADALIDLIHPETGRIHTSFNQTVTATGRLSSSDPNLQNIPIRTEEGREIRKAFIPRNGWRLLSADYSQIELRILAHCSDDPILIQSFRDEEDIHTRTAAEVFQVPADQVTDELRRQAKAINFGIIYGMSAFGLSRDLDISNKMAQTYIDHYFARYPGVKAFIDSTIAQSRESGRTSTLMGRIRHVPDMSSANRSIRQAAERIAINTPIQGTAADLIKLAMIQVDQALSERQMETTMLLSVHDEMIFEVPPCELDAARSLIREKMENVWKLSVPLKVNLADGENWADAH